jgi:Protein of unknown function (DUF2730)
MNIDVDLLLKIASFVLSVGAILYTLYATRRKDVDVRFKAGSDRMDSQEMRILALESTVQNMPGKDEMHQLQLTMTEMAGDLKAVREGMSGLRAGQARQESILGRHEDHLRGESH